MAAWRNLILMTMMLQASYAWAGTRQVVEAYDLDPSTITVRHAERALYVPLGDGRALRYRVALGKPGKQWFGEAYIEGKYIEPAWSPPEEVKRDLPHLPDVIEGGAPNNPMGARALTLDRGQYAIHGTSPSMRRSIGRYASYGCIRMLDEDVIDLFDRVRIGTRIVVVP